MTIDQITDEDLDGLIETGDEEEERGGAYRQSPWWYQKDENSISFLRFLEESPEWRKVATHRFFPTKPEPDKHEGKWPEMMPATCRAAGLRDRRIGLRGEVRQGLQGRGRPLHHGGGARAVRGRQRP
jgi:hypothetical protein